MNDSPKRTQRVPVNLTEREMLDLANVATADNRSIADMAYVILRRYLYGRIASGCGQVQQSRSASQALGLRDFADTGFGPADVIGR